MTNKKGQTTRNCLLQETGNGQVVNSRTNQSFTLADSCVELGPQVAYNAAAHQATVSAVKEFLSKTFAK